ncbi:MAG TPA: helix-turn-helix domain-containing protein [Gemmatimonadaceae bacterium]|nr:helix-turn-helix domain-containing protein [Gemmatimonadaceae bacterium]
MDIHEKLLDAAAQVYAETGYRGATTRRIAQQAGVNEITLFRHFGSKHALIQAALDCGGPPSLGSLPETPRHPDRELRAWCRLQFDHLYQHRVIIRTVLGDITEHPEGASFVARSCPSTSLQELHAYLLRLRQHGMARAPFNAASAAAMLLGALFADAMVRDLMPELHHKDADSTIGDYVKLMLQAIGATPSATSSARPAAASVATKSRQRRHGPSERHDA